MSDRDFYWLHEYDRFGNRADERGGAREAVPFYAAEEYHQDFYKKSALRYKFYRAGSGRDRYLQKTWGEEMPGK